MLEMLSWLPTLLLCLLGLPVALFLPLTVAFVTQSIMQEPDQDS